MNDFFTLNDACSITTGKLDANAYIENGEYPFYTCASQPTTIDTYAYEDDVILIAGNNAQGNFHLNRFFGKFNAYQRTYILTIKENYSLDYIYYALKLELKRLKEHSQGSQTKFLTMPILTSLKFKKRLIVEQEKIACVLSSLDKKIKLNNRINQQLEAMAKTLYDYWFVQFDFPDCNGKPYKSSGGKMVYNEELKREIPEGWKSGIASDLFIFNPSISLSKGILSSYIDMNALPTKGFMTKDIQKKEFNGGVKFQNGDLIIARITPCLENGKTGLVTLLNDDEIGYGSTEFIILRGKTMTLSAFASLLSRSELFRKYAITNMTGTSGRKRVDAKALEVFNLPIPDVQILQKFEGIVSIFFKTETLNTQENQYLIKLRDWLLPMLMNGQVRVSDE